MKKFDENALFGMPVYLQVVIIVFAIIMGIFAVGIIFMVDNSQDDLVKREIERILVDAENMYELGDEGSLKFVDVVFPDSMKFIVFGSTPEGGSVLEPVDLSIDVNTCNNYYFVLDDGSVHTGSSDVKFQGKNVGEFAVFKPGTFTVVLDLVMINGSSYVKIYRQ